MISRTIVLALAAALCGCGGGDAPPAGPPLTESQRADLAVAEARAEHAKAMAAVRAAMVEAIDAHLATVAQSGDLDAAKAVADQREAFKQSDKLPSSPELVDSVAKFITARAAADRGLVLSLEKSVKVYTKLLRLDDASALREQANHVRARHPAELFVEAPPVDPTPAKPDDPPPVTTVTPPDAPDPAVAIDAAITAARAAHGKTIESARAGLLTAYREAIPRAREKSPEIATRLQAELAAFEKDRVLPARTAMKEKVVAFIEAVRQADDDLASAYEAAIEKYIAAERPARASLVRDELARMQQRLVPTPETEDAPETPPPAPPDPVEQAINSARNAHASQLAAARNALLAEIERQYIAATKTGDLALVKAIAAAREAFEAQDEKPAGASFIAPVRAYRTAVRDANAALADAYEEAIKAYTKADAVPLADALNEELLFLRQNPHAAARPIQGAILILTFDREDIYYRKNEIRIRDRSIKHNDARIAKLALAPGKRGQAVELANSQQSVITLEKTEIEGNAPRTIALWLLNRTGNGVPAAFIGIGDGCEGRQFRMHSDHGNYILWGCGAHDFGVDLPVRDRWEHHAVTYDGRSARWYLNGSLHKHLAPHNYITVNSPVLIGAGGFRGLIDEVAVFNRALSDDEIMRVFKHGVR